MARLVHDRDGRPWTVTSRAYLTRPGAGGVPVAPADAALRAVLLVVSGLLALAVLLSTPASLWLPSWVATPVLLAAVASLLLWALGRPWTVTATTWDGGGSDDDPEEVHWVTGPWAARRQVRVVSADLVEWATPPDPDLAGDLPHRR